mgnify:CR=1 FL=1
MTSKTGLEFKVGDAVVYPAHGVGKVHAIKTQEVAGMSLEVYVVTFEHEKMTLRVPTKKAKTAGLRSLAEPWADTTTPAGRMVLTVFAGIAEFERELIHQRTSSGRVAAKARGVRFGRPPKLTPDQIALGERLVSEGTSVREAAKLLKCHHATLYRALTAAALTP